MMQNERYALIETASLPTSNIAPFSIFDKRDNTVSILYWDDTPLKVNLGIKETN